MKKTLNKAERLYKKKLIEELFQKGSYFYLPPFKVYYLHSIEVDNNQVLFSVPKRAFKKAVDRNRIKRQSREAFRLNKERFLGNKNLLIGYIYTAKNLLPFKSIESAVLSSIQKLSQETIRE